MEGAYDAWLKTTLDPERDGYVIPPFYLEQPKIVRTVSTPEKPQRESWWAGKVIWHNEGAQP